MEILTVTGYKPMEINIFNEDDEKIKFVKHAIKKRLISFIEEGLKWVLISGQMGVEMWTADIVFELRDIYAINIAVIPPFENQSKRWPEALQLKYEKMTLNADFYHPIYKGEYKGPYQFRARDMWLIDKSDACLLLIDEEHPGSVKYFKDVAETADDYPVYTITPFDLEEAVEEMRMEDPSFWDQT